MDGRFRLSAHSNNHSRELANGISIFDTSHREKQEDAANISRSEPELIRETSTRSAAGIHDTGSKGHSTTDGQRYEEIPLLPLSSVGSESQTQVNILKEEAVNSRSDGPFQSLLMHRKSISASDFEIGHQSHKYKEWVPPMLRLPATLTLCAVFIALIVVLEILDHFDQKFHGFHAPNSIYNLARYLPTIIAVFLAFLWEMILRDLKKVGPWSIMAGGCWAKAEDALVDVNYIDSMAIMSLYRSLRRRHYGIFLGFLGSFLCVASTPFANYLFFLDPQLRSVSSKQSFIQTSKLVVNDSLTGNETMFDSNSFLAFMGVDAMDYAMPHWTTSEYALESFNLSRADFEKATADDNTNHTITAVVGAFTTDVTCDPVTYHKTSAEKVGSDYDGPLILVSLRPNETDLAKANCNIFQRDYPQAALVQSNLTAWMNYTTCGQWKCPQKSCYYQPCTDEVIKNGGNCGGEYCTPSSNCGMNAESDLRLTMAVYQPPDGILPDLNKSSLEISGLICKIGFRMQDLQVKVDPQTASIISISDRANSTQNIEIKNPESIVLKINKYLSLSNTGPIFFNDGTLFPVEAFLEHPLSHTLVNYYAPDSTMYNNYYPGVPRLVNRWGGLDLDPFFSLLSRGDETRLQEYASNITILASDTATTLQKLLAQIVNKEYRVNTNDSNIKGWLITSTQVLRTRQPSLRTLQGLFISLAIVTLLCGTFLRPKTDLQSDPGTIEATALTTARSTALEMALVQTGELDEKSLRRHLRGALVKTARGPNGTAILVRHPLAESTELPKYLSDVQAKETRAKAYSPFILLLASRIALLVSLAAMIATLGALWKKNVETNGFGLNDEVESFAWLYIPSTLLVIIGYATNATDSAVQGIQPYINMQRSSAPGHKFNPINHSVFTIGYHSLKTARSPLLFASSVLIFLLPATKILAAALFVDELRPINIQTEIMTDISLTNNLDTYRLATRNLTNSQDLLLRLKAGVMVQFAQSEMYSAYGPVGLMDGLIFSNFSDVIPDQQSNEILSSGAKAHLRIPAVQAIPICQTFDTNDYAWKMGGGGYSDEVPYAFCKNNMTDCPNAPLTDMFNGTSSDGQIHWFRNEGSVDFDIGSDVQESDAKINVTDFVLAEVIETNVIDNSSGSPPWLYNSYVNVTNVSSFSCMLDFRAVEVNITVQRPIRIEFGVPKTLPLAITSYEPTSITHIEKIEYKDTVRNWTSLHYGFAALWNLDEMDPIFHVMVSENPTLNMADFLSPPVLAKAGGKVIQHCASQMINLARPYVDPEPQSNITATINATSSRVIQTFWATVAIQALLGTILICVAVVALGVDTKAIITKAPNSIGAQVSLLAGSEMVWIARATLEASSPEAVKSEDLVGIWDGHLITLGWWPFKVLGNGEQIDSRRFGIDIGVAKRE
ncbi:MAG: hypothetical protein M1834_007553 [Cirrosporium novae-zelandiae]|nr:MAG: hypothetical protein M1834_007553 [Cirrosporium novae-zelandiae]